MAYGFNKAIDGFMVGVLVVLVDGGRARQDIAVPCCMHAAAPYLLPLINSAVCSKIDM